jgi:hypothetical protein
MQRAARASSSSARRKRRTQKLRPCSTSTWVSRQAAAWLDYDFEYLATFGALGRVIGQATVVPADNLAGLEFGATVELLLPPGNLTSYPAATRLALTGGTAFRLDANARQFDTASVSTGGIILVRPLSTFIPPQFMRGEPLGIEIAQPERHG